MRRSACRTHAARQGCEPSSLVAVALCCFWRQPSCATTTQRVEPATAPSWCANRAPLVRHGKRTLCSGTCDRESAWCVLRASFELACGEHNQVTSQAFVQSAFSQEPWRWICAGGRHLLAADALLLPAPCLHRRARSHVCARLAAGAYRPARACASCHARSAFVHGRNSPRSACGAYNGVELTRLRLSACSRFVLTKFLN